MGKESKASSLKAEQKVIILRSVAQYLDRCGFSKCFKKLLSEAQIEKKELNSSLPDLDEVFCQFFNKSDIEAVEVKESVDGKKKGGSVDENASDDHEKDNKDNKKGAEVSAMEGVEKVKKKKKKEPKLEVTKEEEEEKVKEADAEIEDGLKEEKKKKAKSESSEAESLGDDSKEKSSTKRKRSEPYEASKRRKKEEETPAKQADVQENGNVEKSGKKSGKGLSNSKEPKKPFQRVNVEEIVFTDERLKDNSYWAKDGADSGYGAKAQEVLGQVRGRGFRHEKTKKKRGSYRGGEIDLQSHSVKFEYSDEE